LIRPDRSERVCRTQGRSEINEDGRVIALVGVCQDVTEQENAAAQLQQAQKMEAIGQLTGGLAHDFNNLLSVIIGNLDFIEGETEATSPVREYSGTALAAALKGSELTQQLLAFSRRQPLAPKVIDLNTLVSNMTTMLSRTIGENIELRLVQSNVGLPTQADPSQVESALLNLVINARDAMPAGGVLTVETGRFEADADYAAANPDAAPGAYSVVAVSDSGLGIAPDVLPKVFEPFFTTKGVGKGSGLGLSMIYGFAKQSAGHVRIYSELGHGTTVRLFLPAAVELGLVPAAAAPVRELPRSHDETVLVVEDNEEVRRIAVRQLGELGYRVLEAENGAAALRVLHANPGVDLLFTDVVMPGGMNGMELVETARRERPGLKVLYTTGFTEAAANTSGGFTGSDGLISKPYRKADLALRLREALEAA
jgi:signal transduction histidine kinase/ActR/RegA family two-component response regulator